MRERRGKESGRRGKKLRLQKEMLINFCSTIIIRKGFARPPKQPITSSARVRERIAA